MRNKVSLRRRQESRVRIFRIGAALLLSIVAIALGAAVCQGAISHDHVSTSLGAMPFLALGGLMFLSPDQGGAVGGSPAEPKPAEPTGETLADKFENAKKIIGDYFKQLSGAMKENDDAVSQVSGLTKRAEKAEGELKTANEKIESLNSQLSSVNGQLTTMTQARDAQTDRATKAEGKITLIESYAKHHNLDLAGLEKFQAAKTPEGAGPENGGNAEGKALYDKWQALKKDSKDARKATAFFRKHKAELQEYADSLG